MTSVRSVVQPGWLEVTGPGVHALVAVADRHAEALGAAASGGLLPLLEALTAHGTAGAPDFVVVAPGDGVLRVLVRGGGTVVLADGTRVGSDGRMPWADVDVDVAAADEEVVVAAPEPVEPRGWRRPARLSRADAAAVTDDVDEQGAAAGNSAGDVPEVAEAAPGAGDGDDAPDPLPLTAAMPVPTPPPAAPVVLAVACPEGHPSPPHADRCRTCDREIAPQEPFHTPRPPLGVLRISTGEVVRLDRGVLLGRAPHVEEGLPADERPHLVRVGGVDRDISRTHAEVVLEGWRVLVRDLGSTNGTTVTAPGEEPERLRPAEDREVDPGAVITLADVVSLTYEVNPGTR